MTATLVMFAFVGFIFSLGFCAGYAVRERKSRERRRRFAHSRP